RTDRRGLLRGGGLAALALGGALTGCTGAGQPSPTASAGGPPGVDAASVPVGGGVVLEDADYVVTQPTEGEYRAFSKVCTHQGCAVSEVADGQITCFCHGSVFSGTDGSVLQGPAEQPLPETPVTLDGTRLVIG
ncbi:QcrA and Rieske domain-containing protein, partial [Desertihabitans aurantiacus]|uniref:QcrA and Rieske domain-containing protein n=1 Tax=Desertihabitans aurantiacus TaxID=2282477 RepID=UPI0018E4E6F8